MRERDEESTRERDRWGSERVRERGRLLKRERERGVRERKRRGEYEIREGKEKPLKTDVLKLYAYNECEHSVICYSNKSFKKRFPFSDL